MVQTTEQDAAWGHEQNLFKVYKRVGYFHVFKKLERTLALILHSRASVVLILHIQC